MARAISLVLLSMALGAAACGSDNVGACKALVADTKCGGTDASDKLDCSSYSATKCDIKPYFDCLRAAYVCVNGHYDVQKLINASSCAPLSKCVVGVQTNPDLATSSGPSLDFSTGGGNPDFSTSGTGGSCADIIDCGNSCSTQSCLDGCVAAGSSAAQSAYNALGSCVEAACPSNAATTYSSSNPCGYNASTGSYLNQTACDSCISSSQKSGGSCYNALQTCGST